MFKAKSVDQMNIFMNTTKPGCGWFFILFSFFFLFCLLILSMVLSHKIIFVSSLLAFKTIMHFVLVLFVVVVVSFLVCLLFAVTKSRYYSQKKSIKDRKIVEENLCYSFFVVVVVVFIKASRRPIADGSLVQEVNRGGAFPNWAKTTIRFC